MNRKHFSILNNLLMLLKSRCALINTASLITSALTTPRSLLVPGIYFFPQATYYRKYKEAVEPALQKSSQLLLFY